MNNEDTTTKFCQELIRCPSITPNDAGCQDKIASRLLALGFEVENINFGKVKNLWAKRGQSGPFFCFAGHTDVVPTGQEELWTHKPFDAHIENGQLFGRGAADMKGALAAMITACERFIPEHPSHPGQLAFLITSDEEGPAIDGTKAVLKELKKRNQIPDWCLVGEPSSEKQLGDMIKVGRRGSVTGFAEIIGKQGHVAYPHLAKNPIHHAIHALKSLLEISWEPPHSLFPETSLQIANIQAGTGATNVIPDRLTADFNIRFAPPLSAKSIIATIENKLSTINVPFQIDWKASGEPFVTEMESPLVQAVIHSIQDTLDIKPQTSTGGGTSDGRFFAQYGCDVVELGVINETIHQINENVLVEDLHALSVVYETILNRLFVKSI